MVLFLIIAAVAPVLAPILFIVSFSLKSHNYLGLSGVFFVLGLLVTAFYFIYGDTLRGVLSIGGAGPSGGADFIAAFLIVVCIISMILIRKIKPCSKDIEPNSSQKKTEPLPKGSGSEWFD